MADIEYMSGPYAPAVAKTLFGMPPATTGTLVPTKPDYIKQRQALHCPQCDSTWVSSPYDPADDPPEHRLKCVDGWTPEYLVYTATYWEGYLLPEEEVAEAA